MGTRLPWHNCKYFLTACQTVDNVRKDLVLLCLVVGFSYFQILRALSRFAVSVDKVQRRQNFDQALELLVLLQAPKECGVDVFWLLFHLVGHAGHGQFFDAGQ